MAFQIIRGTTPTIQYTFNVVSVENISAAILTIKQAGVVKVEKELSAATVGEKTLSWTLTQEESFLLKTGISAVMLNWLTADGTRGASKQYNVEITPNAVNEVIS